MSLDTKKSSLPLLHLEWKRQHTAEYWYQFFIDDFNDGSIGPGWITHGLSADRTIVEAAGVLTIALANNVDGRWWCTTSNVAPKIYRTMSEIHPCGVSGISPPIRITTKLNSMDGDPGGDINDDTFAGIFIGTNPTGLGNVTTRYAWLFGRARDDSAGYEGVRLYRNCGSYVSNGACGAGCLPQWYRINIDAAGTLTWWWSADGIAWTQYEHPVATPFSIAGYDIANSYVGLCGKNIDGNENFSAQFEYFKIEAYGERLIDECVAPIDVRAPNAFYDGRILRLSSLKRAVDDKTGLFQVADMSVTLSNHDKRYSQRLVTHQLKNREAILYHAWTEEPEASKSHIITMIVDDYSLKGKEFTVKMKDITQKYFQKKIPENICTEADFPDIHPDYVGAYMPEIIGRANLSAAYEHPGAVQAIYVDRTGPPYRCLASAGLITIPTDEVWIDDVQKTEGAGADYTVVQAGGRTYIHFNAGQDPGEDVVAFNANGYAYAGWNSANGYIQNLSYIIEYYLRFLVGIPATLINSAAFDTLATQYVQDGVHESCYLIIQEEVESMELLRQLLFTGGAKGFIAMNGQFTIQRKDISNWQVTDTDSHIFDQIELFESPTRTWNLPGAINTIKAQFGYVPWQGLWTGVREEYKENFMDWTREDDIRHDRERRIRRV